jgi:uncharacterized protein (TIGR03790 family)
MKRLLPLVACLYLLPVSSLRAQSGDNVLLVTNESSAESARIADHYARVRGVPQDQVLRVKVSADDEIDRAAFDLQIQLPISNWIRSHSAEDRILYIVLTKGIPLRIRGSSGRNGTVASVDSELSLLYRRLTGIDAPIPGPLPNPYFLGETAVAHARLFSHQVADLYLVTRLDGYTVDDVLKLIDRGAAPTHDGKILLDQRASLADAGGDQWLKAAADWLTTSGFGDRVVLETTSRVLSGEKGVLGYYSWGSNDSAITVRQFGFGFVPGAIAGMYVSTDARTFHEPPATWTTGPWTDRNRFFANSPQSLSGDLIREGVTGVAGHVAEPFLDATIRPNVLFPAYLSGFNLAESFYLAMPYVSWQTVVVGDPLCAPFPRKTLQPSDIDRGIDPATELPAQFAERRLKVQAAQGIKPEAARLLLRAEARGAKDDRAGARTALEEATSLDARLVNAHLLLAQYYEDAKEYDKAIDRYRKILAVNPNHIIALNNLAYGLAVRRNDPADALPYAERAHTLFPSSGDAADTLAWVQHLLGRDREAAALMAQIAKAAPKSAEIRFHAAVCFAAVGMLDAAGRELKEAVRLDATMGQREDVRALQAKIGKK